MVKLSVVKASIIENLNSEIIGIDEKSRKSNLQKKLKLNRFLKKACLYLESNPSVEFQEKMLKNLHLKQGVIDKRFYDTLGAVMLAMKIKSSEISKALRRHRAKNGYKKLSNQIQMLEFLLKK